MNITDVPQSGVYFQQGSIVQLVVQIIDVNTGLPVPLQAATSLTISILYPDRIIAKTYPASLYTDGSDGMIVYTTVNDDVTVDLSEVGLYMIQGGAVIGGVAVPPSQESDFYVLANTFGGAVMPIVNATAVVLFDSSNVRYAGTVNPSGVLAFVAQAEGPANYLQFNSLVMTDAVGTYWTVTMQTNGVYKATPGGSFPHALPSFYLVDENNKTWVITISTQGVLTPA